MRVKNKKVYYCDYCKKHSLKSLHIHEKHCTANPNRLCRLCGRINIKEIVSKYKIDILPEWFIAPHTIDGTVKANIDKMVIKKMGELRAELDGCPACMLTVIRLNKYKWPIEPNYDFQDELEIWWDNKNAQGIELH